ncbi:hypothetical protein QJS10_CPB19g00426 [Acorus calamus]|uniref:Endonuclease/exonuclease/phosphatase domain-containing protein n=1 Tax=Acorus calamus TaxID=4465 RepID=A0AAV9CI85_ACOCL|nr:hypothetical protein QJS10_CPB19g00426 [Acorus calamus]
MSMVPEIRRWEETRMPVRSERRHLRVLPEMEGEEEKERHREESYVVEKEVGRPEGAANNVHGQHKEDVVETTPARGGDCDQMEPDTQTEATPILFVMFGCLIWNIRGLNDPAKRRAIKELVAANRVQVCCIQETKMEVVNRQIIRELGNGMLDEWVVKEARGAAGGILICWNSLHWKEVDRVVGCFSLSVLLEDKVSGGRWCCSSVYGPHEDGERAAMWEDLSTVRAQWNVPVAFVGDFNVTRSAAERNRDGLVTPGMSAFSDWIEEEGLIDLTIANHQYTWSNMREEPSLARLDRVLIDEEWEALFPTCCVRGLPRATYLITQECPNLRDTNAISDAFLHVRLSVGDGGGGVSVKLGVVGLLRGIGEGERQRRRTVEGLREW